MSRRGSDSAPGVLLDLWRPPREAGELIGCLATTYTFAPGLFDEQCLARLLEIESDPNREDLAFLLERESRLGGIYAGVMVDYSQAGVEHSLRWDVLPVRIRGAKQHAKVNLLAWTGHVRLIVASANLTEQGYRTNHEVAAAIDLTPKGGNKEAVEQTIEFLRALSRFIPGYEQQPPAVRRLELFLAAVERQAAKWSPDRRRSSVKQHVVFTTAGSRSSGASQGALEETIQLCRGRGGSPARARIASPFFDGDSETSDVTKALCKAMGRGGKRTIRFAVPVARDQSGAKVRIAAPKALLTTPGRYGADVSFEALPDRDRDRNTRIWHAKMVSFEADEYSAAMIGSSNFTGAGMGTGARRNAEANVLTIVERSSFGRDTGNLQSFWPAMDVIKEPERAEWLGAMPERDEEEQAPVKHVPAGFLAATFHAGAERWISIDVEPSVLPEDWILSAAGRDGRELITAESWRAGGKLKRLRLDWDPVQPPEKLLVQWEGNEAFLPLNVEDQTKLPPPARLENMTSSDILAILAASDPSGAFRAWAKTQQPSEGFDEELDSAVPVDLDPLRRFDLHATFLHRIRRRARVLAQLRGNLQRPVSSRQALEWRLRGLIGIEALADRLVREIANDSSAGDEALLTLADFLIVLTEVEYAPEDGSLSKRDFDGAFQPFLSGLATRLNEQVGTRSGLSSEALEFWKRVVARCAV